MIAGDQEPTISDTSSSSPMHSANTVDVEFARHPDVRTSTEPMDENLNAGLQPRPLAALIGLLATAVWQQADTPPPPSQRSSSMFWAARVWPDCTKWLRRLAGPL